ncbi:MAG: hypothetical protein K8S99_06935 [Planctomycetes bacterium]|nr:hypothetical protein [Planctomycetota bacterium]
MGGTGTALPSKSSKNIPVPERRDAPDDARLTLKRTADPEHDDALAALVDLLRGEPVVYLNALAKAIRERHEAATPALRLADSDDRPA